MAMYYGRCKGLNPVDICRNKMDECCHSIDTYHMLVNELLFAFNFLMINFFLLNFSSTSCDITQDEYQKFCTSNCDVLNPDCYDQTDFNNE